MGRFFTGGLISCYFSFFNPASLPSQLHTSENQHHDRDKLGFVQTEEERVTITYKINAESPGSIENKINKE